MLSALGFVERTKFEMAAVDVTIHDHAKSAKVAAKVNPGDLVAKVKEDLAALVGVAAGDQQLVFKGKILKDSETFGAYNLKAGDTIHLVPRSRARTTTNATTPQQSSTPPAAVGTNPVTPNNSSTTGRAPALPNIFANASGGGNNLFSGLFPSMANAQGNQGSSNAFGGLGLGGLGGGNLQQMREQLRQNPEMVEQMMNSPLMQSLLENPSIMEGMMQNNPQVQQIMEQNPELRHILSDPETMRQTMRMATNPEFRREMMRNQDRAINNIQSHPEGFNALRRMYTEVQEPLYEASMNAANARNPFGNPVTPSVRQAQAEVAAQAAARANSSEGDRSPNNDPLPNPWGRSPGANNSPPATGSPPSVSPNSGLNASAGLGNLFQTGAAAGAGGVNPNLAASVLQSPFGQQMLEQMASNPNFINQMEQSNPALRNMFAANPMLRTLMQNPAFLRQAMSPAAIQASLRMQQAMQGARSNNSNLAGLNNPFSTLFGNSFSGANAATTTTTTTPSVNPWADLGTGTDTAASAPTANNRNPAGGTPQTWAAFEQVLNTGANANQTPAERFSSQLSQLRDMGFTDESSNVDALTATNGNVNAAVERLLGGM